LCSVLEQVQYDFQAQYHSDGLSSQGFQHRHELKSLIRCYVKKLVIVSTVVDGGKGGISSALQGYINGLEALYIPYDIVESHRQDKPLLITWIKAFWQILLLSIKHRKNIVFWFHCGPWLSGFRKFTLALAPCLLGCKTIGHIHSPTFNNYLSGGKVSQTLIKVSLLPFKQLIMLTPWWQKLLTEHKITKSSIVSPNPNSELYCNIAQSYLTKPRKFNSEKDTFEIVTMARLVEGKGVDLVIDALEQLPENYRLTIAGDGPLKNQLEIQVKEHGLCSRITFLGWIDGTQKEELLRSADLFCLPSTYDSFGMVFIEAMAFDLPVIAYGWGPINDVVDSEVGQCCTEANTEEVIRCVKHVCSDLSIYSGKGPARVIEQYTPIAVAKNIIKLLD